MPQDGTVSPLDLLHTLASESRKNGINIIENCEVTKVLVRETRGGQYYKVRGVETTRGTIECDIFVNCAGIVSRIKASFVSTEQLLTVELTVSASPRTRKTEHAPS